MKREGSFNIFKLHKQVSFAVLMFDLEISCLSACFSPNQ